MHLNTGNVYHVLNKSIAGYKIFNTDQEFHKFFETIIYYQAKRQLSFSDFIERKNYQSKLTELLDPDREKYVEIIAYCLMPTHFHFILKQAKDNGISKFLNDALNSYTRYFNAKYKRKGPLWEGKTLPDILRRFREQCSSLVWATRESALRTAGITQNSRRTKTRFRSERQSWHIQRWNLSMRKPIFLLLFFEM